MRGYRLREGHPTPYPPCLTQDGVGGLRGWHACTPNEIHYASHIVLGTSEQLGLWRRCDPTIRTTPTHVWGRVSSAWAFPAMGSRNLGTMGLQGGHGIRNTPWG